MHVGIRADETLSRLKTLRVMAGLLEKRFLQCPLTIPKVPQSDTIRGLRLEVIRSCPKLLKLARAHLPEPNLLGFIARKDNRLTAGVEPLLVPGVSEKCAHLSTFLDPRANAIASGFEVLECKGRASLQDLALGVVRGQEREWCESNHPSRELLRLFVKLNGTA